MISPQGTIYSPTPTYTWVGPMDAESYVLRVTDSVDSSKVSQEYYYSETAAGCASGSANCSVTPTANLADGSYYWEVSACLALDAKICGAFSSKMNFIVSGGLPVAPTLISPAGTIYTSTPTYQWFSVPNATSYWLQVDDSTGRGKIYKGYDASDVGCPSGTGTCSVTPAISLAHGNATWWVSACNQYYGATGGCGPWSNAMGFIVNTGAVTMSLDSKLGWQGTGFVVGQNMEISITATGTVIWWQSYTSGPDGVVHDADRVDDRFNHEAILGRVGNGPIFLVGSSYDGKPGVGELQLITNDTQRTDNSGSFSVTISP